MRQLKHVWMLMALTIFAVEARAAVPGAPTGVTGAPGNEQIEVTWTAPASDGGQAITLYTVTADPGGASCTSAPPGGCTVTGLDNTVAYTFTVVATNVDGDGPASSPSAPVYPSTVPSPPDNLSAEPGDGEVKLIWNSPGYDGGSPVLSYTVTTSPGGAQCTSTHPTTECTVTGLTNGMSYSFTVIATNARGDSLVSNSIVGVQPQPSATEPDPPSGVSGTAGNAQVAVSWTAPASDGGEAITSYTATAAPGGAQCTATAPATNCTVTGLANGTGYTFTVTATNSVGTGLASVASLSVTPRTVPGAPLLPLGFPGNAQVGVSWTQPLSNGGAAILSYTATASPGGAQCTATAPATNCTVVGLTNLVLYTFTVTATNAAGTGPASTPSLGVTPFGPLGISGASTTPPRGTIDFSAIGGSGSGFTWTLTTDNSGADLDANGHYTAGPNGGTTDVVRVVDSMTNQATATITVTAGVSITPLAPAVAPSGTLDFHAAGGSGQGFQWSVTAAPSGGSINASTGVYLAGPTGNTADTVKVLDSLGNSATVNVSVGNGLAINPAEPTAAPRQTLAFTVTGGSGTGYVWSMQTSASGGTIDATGHYTAGETGSVNDVVQVVDSIGNTGTISVEVGAALALSPDELTGPPLIAQQFTASGGAGNGFSWSLATNETGGTLDSTGLYTAGSSPGIDVVKVEDGFGNTATAAVTIQYETQRGCGCAIPGSSGAMAEALGFLFFAVLLLQLRRRQPITARAGGFGRGRAR